MFILCGNTNTIGKVFFFERAYVKNRDDFVRKFRICYPLATDSRK